MPQLVYRRARSEPPVVIPLGSQAVTVGRGEDNTIVLDRRDVSRHHCVVEPLEGGAYRLADRNSTNGTYLNGEPVRSMALELDDRILVGQTVLLYVDEAANAGEILERHSLLFPWSGEEPEEIPGGPRLATAAFKALAPPTEGDSAGTTADHLQLLIPQLSLLGQRVASEVDLSALLELILDELLSFSGYSRGLVILPEEKDPARLRVILGRTARGETLEGPDLYFSPKLVHRALFRGRLVNGRATPEGESATCVPFNGPLRPSSRRERRRQQRRSRFLGAIYLDEPGPTGRRTLGPEDESLLEAVAAQAAAPIQHALLQHQAMTDPLTQLDNRLTMDETLADELNWARETGQSLALVMLDLDHFKRINDTHGHLIGDEVLKRVARRLRAVVRAEDCACRWGGEEFLLLLPGQPLDGALTVAEKVRRRISAQPIGEAQVWVTCSLGVAVFPAHGESADELLEHADQALYAAKAGGRDQVRAFGAAD